MFSKQDNLLIAFFITIALLFYFCPAIDLWFSSFFFDPSLMSPVLDNKGFFLHDNTLVILFTRLAEFILVCVTLWGLYIVMNIYNKHSQGVELSSIHQLYQLLYVLCVCVIGISVIYFMKLYYGRARPFHIAEFGGVKMFTRAFAVSNQCINNCSFISSHAAAGFILFPFSFLYSGLKRKIFILLGIILGATTGLARIISGYHFLSDVVFSGFLLFFISYFLQKLDFFRNIAKSV